MNNFWLVLTSAALTWVLCFPLRAFLVRSNVIDRPSTRSSHDVPTPRGGGIAIILSLLITLALLSPPLRGTPGFWILAAMVLIFLVSFVDDIRSLPSSLRFLCQSTASASVVAALHWRYSRLSEGGILFEALILFIQFFWLVGYTNAFNFMDGINGLAASQAVFTGAASFLLIGLGTNGWRALPAIVCLAAAGAAAGFLPHNAFRARLFMGDVGSASLGFLLAALTLWVAQYADWYLLPPLILLHANFVLDTSITMLRRMARGERWREAHREHFYQRLIRSGLKHLTVTMIEMSLQLVVLGLLLIYLQCNTRAKLGLIALIIAIWLGFFAWADHRFQLATERKAPNRTDAAS
jgi:UDP-N-acetylmuramyl pentapeptide phosphotransferase/UDP-N-acetylglucosamine-1-phosphate transferase